MRKRYVYGLLLILVMIFSTGSVYVSSAQEKKPIKNIILMVGDGMGYEHLKLGSYIEYGIEDGLFIQSDNFFLGDVNTSSADDIVTDSAAAATAMSTGFKVNNGQIGMLPNGTDAETILEYARDKGKSTGLVTSANFYHATPAAFAAHQNSRYDYQEIIEDMITSDTDLILGGGIHLENLRSFMDFDTQIQENNYTEINEIEDFQNLPQGKVIGTFGEGHLNWEADVDYDNEVRLHQLTVAALDKLENTNGFFLMIEGARIDHAGHENNATRNALEMIEFDYTIKLVYEWVQDHPDTIVLITADHETGGLAIESTSQLGNSLPQDSMSENEKRNIRLTRANQIITSYSTTGHTGQNVPLFGFGAGIENFQDADNSFQNTDIYTMMKDGIDGNLLVYPISNQNPDLTSSDDNVSFLWIGIPFALIVRKVLFKKLESI